MYEFSFSIYDSGFAFSNDSKFIVLVLSENTTNTENRMIVFTVFTSPRTARYAERAIAWYFDKMND